MITKKLRFLTMTILFVISLVVFLMTISYISPEYNGNKDNIRKKQVEDLKSLLQEYKEVNDELKKSSSNILVGSLESRQFLSGSWDYLLRRVDSDIEKAEAVLSEGEDVKRRIKIAVEYLKGISLIQKKMIWIKEEVSRASNRIWDGLNELNDQIT